jgi:deoxyribonuclease IV
MNDRRIGFHLSIAGGVNRSAEKAVALGINTFQIFLKNSNQWKGRTYKEEEVSLFKKIVKEENLYPVAHSSYLINCAGTGETYEKSIISLTEELKKADELNVHGLVLHPGSYKERSVDEGIQQIAETLDNIYSRNNISTPILLETMAGQGTSIGSSFEEIAAIMEKVTKNQCRVCLDTAHIFAAGYNLSAPEDVEKTISHFIKTIGIENLALIHLNDSKKECGSKKDRHEHIGNGFIGKKGMGAFLNDSRLVRVPIVMETPKGNDDSMDLMNLETVEGLLKR